MEMEMESATKKQLKHIFHEHLPLVFNKEAWDESKENLCSACQYQLHGESYSCEKCEFHLHKHCAEAPSRIYHHPLHYECERDFLTLINQASDKRYCLVCWNWHFWTIGYGCDSCQYRIDTSCALASLNSGHLKCEFHPHKLVLIQNLKHEVEGRRCSFCVKPLLDSMCLCEVSSCREAFHKKCAESPNPIASHPFHRKHSLLLSHFPSGDSKTCQLCQERSYHVRYYFSCSSCDIWIHGGCLLDPSLVLDDKKNHEHPFNLFFRQHPFICDACGTEGNCVSYVCVSCHLSVHYKCISLPHFIKHTRHPHPISHNYYDVKSFSENKDCRFCYKDVKTEHGSYSCLKQDCDYIVHVNCATEDKYLYNEINEEEARELIKKRKASSESCITCVIKMNELGEAVEINHSFHDHPLLFQKKNEEEENDKKCDGCGQSIFTSFYYCPQCNFFLHKSCAYLSKTTYHWATPYPFTLKFDHIFECGLCEHVCSGFFYYHNEDKVAVCLRCATISDTFVHPSHQHVLFIDFNYTGRCVACDEEIDYAYRCKYCKYALHFPCMTLPLMARHKFDRHDLHLSYHDGDEYQAKHYCDICEEQRDPNLWFYHCSICDNSAHPNCTLGKYPWIKSESIYRDEDLHPHPLTFVRKLHLYPECNKCGDPCIDLALECVTCNYIVHYECKD